MKAELWNILIESGFLAALLGFAVSVVRCAKTYIDSKTAEAAARIESDKIKNAISVAEDCITTVVSELAQTTVEDLKEKSADGKLSAEDAARVKADAMVKIQSLLSDEVQKAIDEIFDDAEEWISSKIEAAVNANKEKAA